MPTGIGGSRSRSAVRLIQTTRCGMKSTSHALLLLDLNTDEKRPLHYRPSIQRDGVVAYETYNQNLVQYNTEGEEKTTLTFQWEHLDNDVADALEALWKGAPHAPELTVYPRPNAEPDKIYIVKWKAGVWL